MRWWAVSDRRRGTLFGTMQGNVWSGVSMETSRKEPSGIYIIQAELYLLSRGKRDDPQPEHGRLWPLDLFYGRTIL